MEKNFDDMTEDEIEREYEEFWKYEKIHEERAKKIEKEEKIFLKKYMKNNIKREEKNNILFHFSELDNEFKDILFYRIIIKKGIKYLILESCSYDDSYIDGYCAIKIYNELHEYYHSRQIYCRNLAENKIYGFNKNMIDKCSNIIELNDFLKYGIDEGIRKISKFNVCRSYEGLEFLFYHNDLQLFNYGKGRKLLNLEYLNENTEEGAYYSYSLLIDYLE